jgi:hypothetical protein
MKFSGKYEADPRCLEWGHKLLRNFCLFSFASLTNFDLCITKVDNVVFVKYSREWVIKFRAKMQVVSVFPKSILKLPIWLPIAQENYS